MSNEKKHRLHVMMEDELHKDFTDTIQWGLRQYLIIAVVKLILDAVKRDGMMVVGALLSGKFKLVPDDDKTPRD